MTAATTVTLCRFDELGDPEARQFVVEGRKIAVVRIGTDVYAIGDTCTHQDFSLAEGEVDPDTCHLECWKHGSSFSLRTGNPDALPATRPVPVYDVRVEGDDVVLSLPDEASAAGHASSTSKEASP